MTEAFERAIVKGITAFAQEFLKGNGVEIKAGTEATTEVAHKEPTAAPATPAEEPITAKEETPAEDPPAAEKIAPAEEPSAAVITEGASLTAEEIDGMDRPSLVDYIVSKGLDQTAAFLDKSTGIVSLKGKRLTTIQEWLKGYFRVSSPAETTSQQAPPERRPAPAETPAEPELQLSLPVDDVPTVSADCSADPELLRKATALMASFSEWSQGQHAERVKQFFRSRGCEGNCVMHDRVNIEGCWVRLNRKTT